jgi:multimeric flavodoxin WrbA
VKVLAIFASPRNNGFSSSAHYKLLEHFTDVGAEITELHVNSLNLNPCIACGRCSSGLSCGFDDDMNSSIRLLTGSDVIIISSPVYFSSLPGKLKIFIDRCQPLWENRKNADKKKYALAILAAGSIYRDQFIPSHTVLRHLFKTIGCRFEPEMSIHISGTDNINPVFIEASPITRTFEHIIKSF